MASTQPRSTNQAPDLLRRTQGASERALEEGLLLGLLAASARAAASRTNLLRLLAIGLLIYGAVGLAAALYGNALVHEAFAGARQLGVMAPGEKSRALQGLQSISTTLDDASGSAANMSGSFGQSQASLLTASQVATQVATAFREVASYTQFNIFGVQPIA